MKSLACLLTGVCLLFCATAFSQEKTHQASWESLDQRPVPQWFHDAKFGIFIHWGPYSVPAWTPKGTYSEWYQYWLQNKTLFGNGSFSGSEVYDFHKKTYGEDYSYYNFGKAFTADLFKPDDWAALFEKAGARYIVITSKHHDGFCLWPSKEANDRGFLWNSWDTGAKRDLLGELTRAIRKTKIKMGFYYSLYEWFHPWWIDHREKFVNEHFIPQIKDLVERYKPDILWGDGEWSMSAEEWKTPELLAWLFNQSSVKDTVAINDRWGKGVRKKHGGYFTTEYESSADFDKPWEECRGMGFSFGYNRNEDAEDYNSPRALVLMLADIVSNGGNLLLDIGPDHRGRIPVIMQERLLQMGKWLETNGQAIYGTRKWKHRAQWSEGRRDYKPKGGHYLGGDYILKQTVDPEPGYAVKEALFTYKDNTLYAIYPKWPGSLLVIEDLKAGKDTTVTLLATNQKLIWRNYKNHLLIESPDYDPNRIKDELNYAYVIRITHVPDFLSAPEIKAEYESFTADPMVILTCGEEGADIRFTLDGSDPTMDSSQYMGPFVLRRTKNIKAKAFKSGKTSSGVSESRVIKNPFHAPVKKEKLSQGIPYSYFEITGAALDALTPDHLVSEGVAKRITHSNKKREDKYGLIFNGYLLIKEDGIYDFYTESDDGSALYLHDHMVVDNSGLHGPQIRQGRIALKQGFHPIQVKYFENTGGDSLRVYFASEGSQKMEIPETLLFYEP